MSDHPHTNRLIHETSPYLLQHGHNPVDWYPWGVDALGAARAEDKPILLSIGYSACHWCHVMERESFENPDIAALMNDLFVNIKVDREERPDLDHIYMTAVQLLTGRGGWPMTVFLRPDGKPFHGGTYFPPVERHGMPAFPRLLELVARKYHESPEDIDQAVSEIAKHLQPRKFRGGGAETASRLLPVAAEALSSTYDQVHGGLGEAPKFPNTAPLDLWLRASHAGGDTRYADMALHTLRQMARGGMYDQLGGGFHRYSVDREWLVPHFEKMLYDNAQLVPLYLSAYQNTGDVFFANIARDTLDYVVREMRDPRGGFYSSQDADSEGVEGKYFVWDRREVVAILGAETADVVCRYWDITEPGNFEGRNILRVILETGQLGRMFGDGDGIDESRILSEARDKLLAARRRRIAPARDDKMLTSWNALMISAFARAGEVFGDAGYAEIARGAVAFVDANLRRDTRLLATCTGAGAKLNGYLDDYAFYAAALLDVFEAVQDRSYLDSARTLCDAMLAHFWDDDAGGLFFTSDDHENLIVRTKPTFDGSIPSGNSVATMVLLRLYHHTTDARYLERAETVLSLLGPVAADQPFGLANLIAAADFHHRGPREIAVVVDRATSATDPIVRRLRATYLPNRTLTFVDPDPTTPRPTGPAPPLATLLAGKGQVDGKTTVYVCHRMTCSPPATEWEDIAQLLS